MNKMIANLIHEPNFIALCKIWETEGRAPYGLYLWLKDEMDLEWAAEAVLWCYLEPDRNNFSFNELQDGGVCPIFIDLLSSDKFYCWCRVGIYTNRCDIPDCIYRDRSTITKFDTFPDAILWLIRRWDEVRPVVVRDPQVIIQTIEKDGIHYSALTRVDPDTDMLDVVLPPQVKATIDQRKIWEGACHVFV